MSIDRPFVSLIIPCRNEARRIGRAIESLATGDYPEDRRELLVVDGSSEDGTPEAVLALARRWPGVRLLRNPARTVPHGLNLGLQAAVGAILMRADAHACYPPDYVSTLVSWLSRSGASNVGCSLETVPGAGGIVAAAIARAMAHPFGVGNSRFRLGAEEPAGVDTVPFGCYPREVFERIGMFDEELTRNQDDEFNWRLRRAGGRIILVPRLRVRYFARGTLAELCRMAFGYGLFKPLVLLKTRRIYSWRALAPGALVGGIMLSGMAFLLGRGAWFLALPAVYAACNAGIAMVSGRDGLRGRLALMAAFACLHAGYGCGFLMGLLRLPGRKAFVPNRLCDGDA